MNIDWYLTQAPSEEHAILAQLTHEFLLSVIPNGSVKRKYGTPFYTYRKDLCYLNFNRDRPYISFLQGASMMDSPLLEKTKKNKYAKFYIETKEIIYENAFATFLMEAITIQDELYKK